MLRFHSDVFKTFPRTLEEAFGPHTCRIFEEETFLQALIRAYKNLFADRNTY